jgi:precorrin-6B methylase 2
MLIEEEFLLMRAFFLVNFRDSVLVEEAVELKELIEHAGALVRIDGVLVLNFFDVENHLVLFLLLEVSCGDSEL